MPISCTVVNMKDLNLKDMKQNIFFWTFRLSRGQPSETFSLPPANSTQEQQVVNCLFLTL